jgi:hypothetical protein
MRENMRLYATLAIWFAFMVMTTVIFVASDAVSNAEPNTAVFIALIFAMAAAISTAAVWISGIFGDSRGEAARSSASRAKRKRVDPEILSRLVDGLNDEELDELEMLLIAREETDAARHDTR